VYVREDEFGKDFEGFSKFDKGEMVKENVLQELKLELNEKNEEYKIFQI
jgi:hypothetical protein